MRRGSGSPQASLPTSRQTPCNLYDPQSWKEYVFKFVFFFPAAPCSTPDCNSLTRDEPAPCSGSVESEPLDRQGGPWRELNK